jgi:hypothetical protein
MEIEPEHVVDYRELAKLGIDATMAGRGENVVINPDHAMLKLGRCDDHEQ